MGRCSQEDRNSERSQSLLSNMIHQEPGSASEDKSLRISLTLQAHYLHLHTSWAIFLMSSQVETLGSHNRSLYMTGMPQRPLLAELLQHFLESQVHHTTSPIFPMPVP